MSAREQQLAAAKVLVTLLSEELPVASWSFYSDGKTLNGQITERSGTAAERRQALEIWAAVLGVEVSVIWYAKQKGGEIAAQVEIEGVSVRVWSWFPKRDLPKAAPEGDA